MDPSSTTELILPPSPCGFCNWRTMHMMVQSDNFVGLVSSKHPDHCLVVPKKHVEDLLDLAPQERFEFFELATQVAFAFSRLGDADGYTIQYEGGDTADKRIPHICMHVVPRRLPEEG